MIDEPSTAVGESFQQAWVNVTRMLIQRRWEIRNLMVQIRDANAFDANTHRRVEAFCEQEDVLGPRHVAYTIFPEEFYKKTRNVNNLFNGYNRRNGLYDRLQRRYANASSWGTYFRRMTCYETGRRSVNQLADIIRAIRARRKVNKAALTIVIQKPGGETIRPLGGPCLNYLAVQAERNTRTTLGLLAVYRNHDFLQKAYGNYWGLCNLLRFLARETDAVAGPVTCVSSHAYVDKKKAAFRAFVQGL